MTEQRRIWGDINIPVLGVSGEKYSGKTLFLLGIDPEGCLFIDTELSGVTYNVPVKRRIDLFAHMRELAEKKAGPNGRPNYEFKSVDTFLAFRDIIEKTPANVYTNICCDVISDVGDGLANWVLANPGYFGRTAQQYQKASGLFRNDVNIYWKNFLGRIATRCQTFAYSVHMRNVWVGGIPTTKREAKGGSVIQELTSLHLHLERDLTGSTKMEKPHAIVVKSRLSVVKVVNHTVEVQEILPPRIKDASPDAIRAYIKNPVDPKKLKKDEQVQAKVMTDDERLMVQAEIAAANAATAELNATSKVLDADAKKNEQTAPLTTGPSGTSTDAVSVPSSPEPTSPVSNEPETSSSPTPEPSTIERPTTPQEKLAMVIASTGLVQSSVETILEKRGVKRIQDLTDEQADEIRVKIWNKYTMSEVQNSVTL